MNGTKSGNIDRRKFMGGITSAALAFSIVPRHVLGGANFIAPSDKITLAYIGTGTQGLREMLPLLSTPEIQITAVCDPCKSAVGYRDWGREYLRNEIRNTLKNPAWNPGGDNVIPGGRDNAKEIVDSYYGTLRKAEKFKACTPYADFRELFVKEKSLDAVKIMTPDHLHGIIAMAALKRGKHVTIHKPIANRLKEGKEVIDLAKKTSATTHLIAWDSNQPMDNIMEWINSGAIGTLKEVHNWTNRPVWPQYPSLPTNTPTIPTGMDWDLWLGPESDRPYHPNYTNMVFRGWYDFGGGSMADMGHYSLWTVLNALQLEAPTIIEPNRSHVCDFNDVVPFRIKNDFSFPLASSVRFKFPAKGKQAAIDLCWYDGGMRPAVTEALYKKNKEMPAEGMMFVGDQGIILAGFHGGNPQIISGKRAGETKNDLKPDGGSNQYIPKNFIEGCLTGKQCAGSLRDAWPITEVINLYAVALRTGKTLFYDSEKMEITNDADANKYLTREYRKGWDPSSI
ncbi:MAG: Gfo/Idh/MocA family oxidoreductase [Cyclobacteriaceae bacterium]|nr:Gfo/Idh/MocA family oxidoreductase [Cyclobacteriaceae bacterium]